MRRLLLRLLASAPSATDHVSDAELLRRFMASNDSAAFELIVRRHADAVWAACRRMLRFEADAEDAFQAAFLALIRKAGAIRTPCVGGWLHRVAVNAALKLRERSGRTSSIDPNELNRISATTASTPDADVSAAIHEELALLTERERLPVVLCDLDGLSHADAAAALGWPVGTVSGRLSRARAKLRERLTRRGLTPSAALLPALVAPPHLIPKAVQLTAGVAPPAVVSLTEGVLAMMATTTWKWIAVAAVCAGLTGAGAAIGLTQPGKPMPPPGGAVPPPVAGNPDPPAKDKSTDEDWLPKLGKDGRQIIPRDYTDNPTAFPKLTKPVVDITDPKPLEKYEADFAKMCPHLTGKTEIVIEATDDTLRKLLKARLHQGVLEIRTLRAVIGIGTWSAQFYPDLIECLTDMQATATELWGGQPKELIPWLEELVVVAKEVERFTWIRVVNGVDSPQRLNAARRHRLRAEAALWKAKKTA